MKPYGIPRFTELESPDVDDIKRFAMKSATGRLRARNDNYHSYSRTSRKKATRRYFKKSQRQRLKLELRLCDRDCFEFENCEGCGEDGIK